MSEFRDAIERTVQMSPIYTGGVIADEVLAMPEMQNIKATLRDFADVCCWTENDDADDATRRRHLQAQGVDKSVIAWVLDEGSNP